MFLSMNCYSQKTFTDSIGKVLEIKEFPKTYTIDSCLIIEKSTEGWKIPDTLQLKYIHSQWFGKAHMHYTNSAEHGTQYTQDIEGSKFLSSTKYDGGPTLLSFWMMDDGRYDNYKIFLADSEYSMGGKVYYSLLLVKPK
jgi:hypothetical protein